MTQKTSFHPKYSYLNTRNLIAKYRGFSSDPLLSASSRQAAKAIADTLLYTWSIRLTVEYVVQWVSSTRNNMHLLHTSDGRDAQERLLVYGQFLSDVGVQL